MSERFGLVIQKGEGAGGGVPGQEGEEKLEVWLLPYLFMASFSIGLPVRDLSSSLSFILSNY